MARWRVEALKRLPELKEKIESAPQIMAFWIEALHAFEDAYDQKPPDESLISRVYDFADWCEIAPRNPDAERDPLTAVNLCFYEHIPTIPAARADMPKWFTFLEVSENRSIFSYLVGQDDYQQLLQHMQRNRRLYLPRKSKPGDA
jgi:hypothetical protein